MKKVIFLNESGQQIFIVTDLSNFETPRRKDEIVWMHMIMTVKSIVRNYDKKEIEVWCEVE